MALGPEVWQWAPPYREVGEKLALVVRCGKGVAKSRARADILAKTGILPSDLEPFLAQKVWKNRGIKGSGWCKRPPRTKSVWTDPTTGPETAPKPDSLRKRGKNMEIRETRGMTDGGEGDEG